MLEFLLPPGLLAGTPPSWYCVVRPHEFRAPRYDGKPRQASANAETRILILEGVSEDAVFVARYADTLGYLSDTPYPTREAAITGCHEDFGDKLGPWLPVPAHERHPESYVLGRLAAK